MFDTSFSNTITCQDYQNLSFSTIRSNRANEDKILLVPNPASQSIALLNTKASIDRPQDYEIIDALGKIVSKGVLENNVQYIDIISLNNGFYTVKIINKHDNLVESIQFIKIE